MDWFYCWSLYYNPFDICHLFLYVVFSHLAVAYLPACIPLDENHYSWVCMIFHEGKLVFGEPCGLSLPLVRLF